MAIVRFYVMRHGEKDGDALTPKGEQQVRDSATMNLRGLNFHSAFYSGMNRAKQTIEVALDQIRHEPVLEYVEVEEGFGYIGTEKEFPIADHKKVIDARAAAGESITVLDWLKEWTGAAIMRGRIQMTLLFVAKKVDNEVMNRRGEFNVLVGSHSPTGELACLSPSDTRTLREADICLYEVEVSQMGEAKIVSSTILCAPY